jgi:circadian clock protein KaiC
MSERGYKCISTGNPEMDKILRGGFPENSINIIMGQPGTGKTIFAEQLIFHHAKENSRPILYLTTLSEPMSKILTYLQRFTFFDVTKIGTAIQCRDIGFDLTQNGIGALNTQLKNAIHELAPKIIVVDSFKALHDLAETPQEMRRALYELTGMLAAYETTVFFIGEYTEENSRILPEFAIADGIVQFLRSAISTRDERFVRVLKLRGSSYLEGLHGCRITSSGIDIFPRLISPAVPEKYTWQQERIKSGIDGFDQMVGGGLLRGSSTLLEGNAGAGKSIFSLQFALEGLREQTRSLYVNFQENPTQLSRSIRALGFSPDECKAAGLELLYESPVELQIDSIIVKIFRLIEEQNIQRVVIDAINDLEILSRDLDRVHDYIYSLAQHLAVKGITTVMTYETKQRHLTGTFGQADARFSNMSDNIVTLDSAQAPDFKRTITCLKARGTEHDLKPHEFKIKENGIHIT